MSDNNDSGQDEGNNGKNGRPPQNPPSTEDAKNNQGNSSPNPWAKPANTIYGPKQGAKKNSSSSEGGNPVDDLIDAAQERIRTLFTGGGPSSPKGGFNGAGGFKGGVPKGTGRLAALAALGVVAIWLGSGFYRVQEGETGVVLRFGEMVRTSLPGLQYHLPAPFESVIVQKVAVLNTIDGGMKMDKNGDSAEATLILTGDENMVHTNYTVLWKIKDVSDYLFTASNPESTIRVAAESVVREVIGQTTARLALTEGRGQIEIRAQEILQKLLDHYKMGIQIVSIQLQNVAPPHQVVDAFNDLQASLVNADQSRNDAEAYRNEIIPRAEGLAAQIANEATAYAQRTIAEAQGEAGRFSQVCLAYEAYPAITLKRYYLETMQQVMSRSTKIILDKEVSKTMVPFLPLNEIKGLPAIVNSKGAEK